MKSIINGQRYNTEAPRTVLIGEIVDNGKQTNDFSYWTAGLYRTGQGKYFLAGSGGPMTQFGERYSDGSWGASKKIIPISADHARDWAERYLLQDSVESHFPATDA